MIGRRSASEFRPKLRGTSIRSSRVADDFDECARDSTLIDMGTRRQPCCVPIRNHSRLFLSPHEFQTRLQASAVHVRN